MRTLCLFLLLAGAAGGQDAFLDTLKPSPARIEPYSESLAPMYEGVFPTGEPHPSYAESLDALRKQPDFQAASRAFRADCGEPSAEPLPAMIRQADFDAIVKPGLRDLAKRAGAKGPVVLGVALSTEVPDVARSWVVQGVHAPRVEALLRPWLMSRSLAKHFPGLPATAGELTARRLVDWLRRGNPKATVALHVESGPSHPAWKELAAAGGVPFAKDAPRADVVYHESQRILPICGWGLKTLATTSAASEEPGTAPLVLPEIAPFDEARLAAVFRQDDKGLYDKWQARSTDFRSVTGSLLLRGLTATMEELRAMERSIRQAPSSVLAQRAHRPSRMGDRNLIHHFFVLADGEDVLVPLPGAAQAIADSGGAIWLPGAVARERDPAASGRTKAALPPRALEAAARFDAARYEALVRHVASYPNRANGLPGHQLEEVAQYLAGEYRKLGLEPRFDRFEDGGRPWTNLSADLAGETTEVVILADHYDTAIDEGSAESGDRSKYKAAPGADDNATATAALVESGRVLASLAYKPRRTIRLLHLTGEEYPTDCLGARHYAEAMLRRGERVAAFLVMDMIGRKLDGGSFQLNEGEVPASGGLSGWALSAAGAIEGAPAAIVRSRFDPKSYLYNTDGVIFSDLGVPTLLFNERVNRMENFTTRGNHDAYDTADNIDYRYAAAIARVALMTAIAAAER